MRERDDVFADAWTALAQEVIDLASAGGDCENVFAPDLASDSSDCESDEKPNETVFRHVMPSASARQTLAEEVSKSLAPLAENPEAVHRILDQVRHRIGMPGGTNRGRLERSVLSQLARFPKTLRAAGVKESAMALNAATMATAPRPVSAGGKARLTKVYADTVLHGRTKLVQQVSRRRCELREARQRMGGTFTPAKKPRGKIVPTDIKQSAHDYWIKRSSPRMERTQGEQPRVRARLEFLS